MDWHEDKFGQYDVAENTYVLAPNVPRVVALLDVSRVTLWWSVITAGTAFLSTKQSPATNSGLLVAGNNLPVELNVGDDGPLVGQQWTALSAAGTSITVFEVFHRRRPGGGDQLAGPAQPSEVSASLTSLNSLLDRLRDDKRSLYRLPPSESYTSSLASRQRLVPAGPLPPALPGTLSPRTISVPPSSTLPRVSYPSPARPT